MAANKEAIFVGGIIGKTQQQVGTGAATALLDVFDGDDVESTRLDSLVVSTNDSVARDLYVNIHDGTASRVVACISLPSNSGYGNAVKPLDVLAHDNMKGVVQTDANGNKYMNIPPGWKIKCNFGMTNSSAYVYNFVARGGKY